MKRILIGQIAGAHGVKGLVKLHIYAEDPDLLDGVVSIGETGDDTLTITLKNPSGKHWLATVDGATDRTAAENLKGTKLYIDRAALPDPDDGEYYHTDLIGINVVDPDGAPVGKVIAVQNFGAGDLLEIKPVSGHPFYLPFVDEYVPDITEDKITVVIPEGLME